MKTIEERAERYVGTPCDIEYGCVFCEAASICKHEEYVAFIAGAQSEHKELTHWHSESERPQLGRSVLIKCKRGRGGVFYVVGCYNGRDWCYNGALITDDDMVIGWREIHK